MWAFGWRPGRSGRQRAAVIGAPGQATRRRAAYWSRAAQGLPPQARLHQDARARRRRRPPMDAMARPSRSGRFVVQRHRATRLHYDFRLEIDGVLVSWAVPKGPTLDPTQRRMAVHVEDHPIEYFDFEGVIPAKQYGAGDVIVWDWGTWEPEAPTLDGRKAIEDGELKFVLKGEKLRGRFTIVRTGGRRGAETGRPFEDDRASSGCSSTSAARVDRGLGRRGPSAERQDRSHERRGQGQQGRDLDQPGAGRRGRDRPVAARARRGCPATSSRCWRRSRPRPSATADWLFEIKWDGYRVEAVVRDGEVRLFTRNLNDAETYFRRLLSPPSWIDAREAIVDGEVVALDENGGPTSASSRSGSASSRRAGDAAARVPGRSTCSTRRAVAARRPARVAQAAAQDRAARAPAGPLRVARRRRGLAFRRGRQGARPRGDRGQAAALALRARPPLERLAQDQDPARAGARRRRLDAGRGQRQGPRRGRGRVYEDGKLRFAGKVGSGFTA